MRVTISIFIFLLPLLASCTSEKAPFGNDQYEPTVLRDELVVVNKRTGDAFVIRDGERYPVYDAPVPTGLSVSGRSLRAEMEANRVNFYEKIGKE